MITAGHQPSHRRRCAGETPGGYLEVPRDLLLGVRREGDPGYDAWLHMAPGPRCFRRGQ